MRKRRTRSIRGNGGGGAAGSIVDEGRADLRIHNGTAPHKKWTAGCSVRSRAGFPGDASTQGGSMTTTHAEYLPTSQDLLDAFRDEIVTAGGRVSDALDDGQRLIA